MWKWLDCRCSDKWHDVAPLVLRVATGLVFFVHGYMKLTTQGVPGVSGFLGTLGFPIPDVFAVILIATELVGGAALIAGLFTHWAAKLTAVVAILALVLVHMNNGFLVQGNGYEFILLLFAATISLMVTGAGRYSLDHYLFNRNG